MVSIEITQHRWTGEQFDDSLLGEVRATRWAEEHAARGSRELFEQVVEATRPPALLRMLSPALWARRMAAQFVQPQMTAEVVEQQAVSAKSQAGGDTLAEA